MRRLRSFGVVHLHGVLRLELVIADGRQLVADRVHRLHVGDALVGVGQRPAREGVARVHEDCRIFDLPPQLANECGPPRRTADRCLLVLAPPLLDVGEREDVAVQVVGVQNREREPVGRVGPRPCPEQDEHQTDKQKSETSQFGYS